MYRLHLTKATTIYGVIFALLYTRLRSQHSHESDNQIIIQNCEILLYHARSTNYMHIFCAFMCYLHNNEIVYTLWYHFVLYDIVFFMTVSDVRYFTTTYWQNTTTDKYFVKPLYIQTVLYTDDIDLQSTEPDDRCSSCQYWQPSATKSLIIKIVVSQPQLLQEIKPQSNKYG